MGNCSSPLRQAINRYDAEVATNILHEAGPMSADVINEDQTADCILDILCCSVRKQSPMFHVVAQGNVEMANVLIKYGADLGARGAMFNETLLHWAMRRNRINMVQVLCENEPSLVDALDCDERSTLHWLCMSSKIIISKGDTIEVLKYILERMKPDTIQQKDVCEHDALFYAKKYEYSEIVSVLENRCT